MNPLYETMLVKQREWMSRYSPNQSSLLDQIYINTYFYHYREEDILLGKPWDLSKYQVPPSLFPSRLL
jgi:hypothetical protein